MYSITMKVLKMENSKWRSRFAWLFGVSLTCLLFFLLISGPSNTNNNIIASSNNIRKLLGNVMIRGRELSSSSLELTHQYSRYHNKVVVLNNGVVELTIANPGGDVIGIKYNGIDNLLETRNPENSRGYWDIVWGDGSGIQNYSKIQGTKFKVVKEDENQIEISFSRSWNDTSSDVLPVNVDQRYVMLRDYPGFYTYAIIEHPKEAPASWISVVRVCYKAQEKEFQYMAVSDDRRRIMPTFNDRNTGQKLAYPEAVILTNPSNKDLKGEVDDKYQYSSDHKDIKVHGWISTSKKVGLWMVTPSHEYFSTGPMKQELTSHAGPTTLTVFMSRHYVGEDIVMNFKEGEEWKKVYGPVNVYLNSVSNHEKQDYHDSLWEDAKKQADKEISKWPYNFINSNDFPLAHQRGNVKGQLLVHDRYLNESSFGAKSAYVGLAAPGEIGSWQRESKGYQFWVKADEKGNFIINNVRPGTYNLYAFVPGIIGDYMYEKSITIKQGSTIDLASIVYEPPRNGPTLWEIGIPDRTASEYYVPDPLPTLTNPVFNNKLNNKFRQYGLWDRYTDLYPNEDLVYTIGSSDYRRDWFYAHVNRNMGNGKYNSTTWQVKFNLENVRAQETYTLQIAIASATGTDLQVRFNNPNTYRPMFTTHLIGRDNSIARHGIHGLYWLYSVNVPGNILRQGNNILYLTQSRSNGPFGGLMYDYIRFEGPSQ